MADYQTCFCPECRGCLRSRRTVFRHRNLYGLDRYTENIKCSGQPSKKAKFSNLRTSEIPGKSFLLLIALCRFKYICMPRKSSTGKTYWEKKIWDWTWGIWNSKSRICNQGIWTIRQNKSKKVNLIGKSKWIWLNYNGIFNFTWWCISIFFFVSYFFKMPLVSQLDMTTLPLLTSNLGHVRWMSLMMLTLLLVSHIKKYFYYKKWF